MKPLKVIIVDDNEAFRKALSMMLTVKFKATVIADVSSADEFQKIEFPFLADIIFMDIMMPEVDGILLAKRLLFSYDKLKIIAITMYTDKVYLTSLIEAGFMGCIFKNDLFKDLEQAIHCVLGGQRFFPKDMLLEDNN